MDASETPEETTREARSTRSQRRAHEAPRHRRARRIVAIIFSVIVAIILILAGLFAWNRWWRYDDAADLQGEWYILGTASAITIDGDSINLNPQTEYAYGLDTWEKTIVYTLGNLSGQGRYWFGENREYLVIQDGDGFSAMSTLLSDLQRMFEDLGDRIRGNSIELPQGEGVIVLSRQADRTALALSKDPVGSASASDQDGQADQPDGSDTDASREDEASTAEPAEGEGSEGADVPQTPDSQPEGGTDAGQEEAQVPSTTISDDIFASISDMPKGSQPL